MMKNWFDHYSLQARVTPALLSLFPVFLLVYIKFPQLYNEAAGLFSLILACGVITLLAHYARSRGKGLERNLQKRWGGRPTTLLLLNQNGELDSQTHKRYLDHFAAEIPNWQLNEDRVVSYESAILWLLEKTRETERFNLIFKENISYGFRRNCLGMKPLGLCIALICSALWAVDVYALAPQWSDVEFLQWMGFGVTLLLLAWWLFLVRENWVREAADSYAKALLGSIDTMVSVR